MRETTTNSPSMDRVIVEAIQTALFDLHTGLPGRVVAVHEALVDVQPLLQRTVLDVNDQELTHDLPILVNVPIQYPAWGTWSVTAQLVVGDTVFLAFCERSLDIWLDAPEDVTLDPLDARKHDLSDAVAIPSLRRKGRPLPLHQTDLWIGNADGSVRIALCQDGTVRLGSAAASKGVARATDPVRIDPEIESAVIAWATAVGAAAKPQPIPFPTTITKLTGTITSGSAKVKADD